MSGGAAKRVINKPLFEAVALSDGGVKYTHSLVPIVVPSIPRRRELSPEEVQVVKGLRKQDPRRFSQGILARRFNVTKTLINTVAPLPAHILKAIAPKPPPPKAPIEEWKAKVLAKQQKQWVDGKLEKASRHKYLNDMQTEIRNPRLRFGKKKEEDKAKEASKTPEQKDPSSSKAPDKSKPKPDKKAQPDNKAQSNKKPQTDKKPQQK